MSRNFGEKIIDLGDEDTGEDANVRMLSLYKAKTDPAWNAFVDSALDSGTMVVQMRAHSLTMGELIYARTYIKSKMDGNSSATRNYVISDVKNATIGVKLNKKKSEYFALGFPMDKKVVKDFPKIRTAAFIDTVVSLTNYQDEKVVPITYNDHEVSTDMSIKKEAVTTIASILSSTGSTSNDESKIIVMKSIKQKRVADLLVNCCPPILKPTVTFDNKREDPMYTIRQSGASILDIKQSGWDAFLLKMQTMSKKSNFAAIANAHVTGKNFLESHVYFEFLYDMRNFFKFRKEETVILHTADSNYAVTLANAFPDLNIILQGTGVKKCGRYNTSPIGTLYSKEGLHIIVDPIVIESEKGKTRFIVGTKNEEIDMEYVKTCKGEVLRRASVFQVSELDNYIPSIGMRTLTFWQYIGEKNREIQLYSFDEMKKHTVDAAAHWYQYPWTRIPLYLQSPVIKYNIFGSYDFRVKKEDIDGLFNAVSADDNVKKLLDELEDCGSPEIRNVVTAQKAAIEEARLASYNKFNASAGNNNNNSNAHDAVAEEKLLKNKFKKNAVKVIPGEVKSFELDEADGDEDGETEDDDNSSEND